MPYANRVNLQGYLEIEKIDVVRLNGKSVPVLHGFLHSGSFLASHRLLITDSPAALTLDLMRKFQDYPDGQVVLEIEGQQVDVSVLKGKPLVAVEGRLLSRPNQESVVDVKWITFLSIAPSHLAIQDDRLVEIINRWNEIREADREHVYQFLLHINRSRQRSG